MNRFKANQKLLFKVETVFNLKRFKLRLTPVHQIFKNSLLYKQFRKSVVITLTSPAVYPLLSQRKTKWTFLKIYLFLLFSPLFWRTWVNLYLWLWHYFIVYSKIAFLSFHISKLPLITRQLFSFYVPLVVRIIFVFYCYYH